MKDFIHIIVTLTIYILSIYLFCKLISFIYDIYRRKILDKYTIPHHQAKFRVLSGEEVYAGSDKDKTLVMLSGHKGNKIRIQNLFSGKDAICDASIFIKSFNSLTENGYKFYDSKSYKFLRKRGFLIS